MLIKLLCKILLSQAPLALKFAKYFYNKDGNNSLLLFGEQPMPDEKDY